MRRMKGFALTTGADSTCERGARAFACMIRAASAGPRRNANRRCAKVGSSPRSLRYLIFSLQNTSAARRAKAGSVLSCRVCLSVSPAISVEKWRRVTSRKVLSINWNGPNAVERGFLASLRPPDSAAIRRSRKISKDERGALSASCSANPSFAVAETGADAPSPHANTAAAAKLGPRERVRNDQISPVGLVGTRHGPIEALVHDSRRYVNPALWPRRLKAGNLGPRLPVRAPASWMEQGVANTSLNPMPKLTQCCWSKTGIGRLAEAFRNILQRPTLPINAGDETCVRRRAANAPPTD